MKPTEYIPGSGFTLADGMYIPDVFVRTTIVIVIFYIVSSFLLTLIRILLNHRLKSKMIGLGNSAEEIEKILALGPEAVNYAVKWFFLLLGAAIGFGIIHFFRFGWLSVATVTGCLSLGYAGYYLYLNKRRLP